MAETRVANYTMIIRNRAPGPDSPAAFYWEERQREEQEHEDRLRDEFFREQSKLLEREMLFGEPR